MLTLLTLARTEPEYNAAVEASSLIVVFERYFPLFEPHTEYLIDNPTLIMKLAKFVSPPSSFGLLLTPLSC